MTDTKGVLTIEEKLRALYQLQRIDSKIDEIRILRGELPIEVKDLEDEIEGLALRIKKLEEELSDLESFVSKNEVGIEEAKKLIEKYGKQLNNIKNNREYDALNKEIEMQKLEIELCKKKIRDTQKQVVSKKSYLKESKDKIVDRKKDLEIKKKDLETINESTRKEEEELLKQSEAQAQYIERRLIQAYQRIRTTYRNGLGVVTVERDSCGGCFGKIPPQRQLEIRQRKKLILCEHCGRLLVDPRIQEELEEV